MNYRFHVARGLAAVLMMAPAAAGAADWQPVEQVKTYAISGTTGAALYEAIGKRAPQAGGGLAIAHTGFKLTWTRTYEPQGSACAITVAKPRLIITYTLPKPSGRLAPDVAASWTRFISGVEKHERVHGTFIKDLVQQIQDFSLGLRVENDPDCQKIRQVLTARLGELSKAERAKNVEFDRVELNPGGNVHQLILSLVNGP
ncbi:putative secreted Zn-dependent protease [Neorhizobium galegae]|nr:putative secreted Zn-dependent protease [Neorhizobium galegae]